MLVSIFQYPIKSIEIDFILELLANLGELAGVDGDQGGVLGVWDAQVLDVESDEVQGELGGPSCFLVLELDLQSAWILISLESNGVSGIGQLHDLGEVGDVDAEDDVAIAPVLLKALHAQIQGHKGDVGSVHGLQGDA